MAAQVGQRSHDPIISPAGVLPSHLNDQRLNLRRDSRSPGITAVFRAVEFAGNQPPVPAKIVYGLATQATCARALRPSRLPISASVDLYGLDRRNRAGRCARRIRLSAAK